MRHLNMGERVEINDNMLILHVDAGHEDINAILLSVDGNEKIKDDRFSILETNPNSPEGSMRLTKSTLSYRYDIDLSRIPTEISALLIVVYSNKPIFQSLPLAITIENAGISFNAGQNIGSESAIVLAKIYKHQSKWKFNAVTQGYEQGIERLIQSLGGETQ